MPSYEEFASYRAGHPLTANEQSRVDAAKGSDEAYRKIAMERANAQLQKNPIPESPVTGFPHMNPAGLYGAQDMSFSVRLQALRQQSVQNMIASTAVLWANKADATGHSPFEQLQDAIKAENLANRAQKNALRPEDFQAFGERADKLRQDHAPLYEKTDQILTAFEYMAGLREELPADALKTVEAELGIPVAEQESIGKNASLHDYTPSVITLPMDGIDNIRRQNYLTQPEHWNETIEQVPPPTAEEAKQALTDYSQQVTKAELDELYGRVEGRTPISADPSGINRGNLITIGDKTVSQLMRQQYDDTKTADSPAYEDWYKENLSATSANLVTAALMAGTPVEASMVNAKGALIGGPIGITTGGHPYFPTQPQARAAVSQFTEENQMGAIAVEPEQIQECRQQMKDINVVGQCQEKMAQQKAFIEGYIAENGSIEGRKPAGNLSVDADSISSACVCGLASQGHSFEDIFDPDTLQAEKQAAGTQYLKMAFGENTPELKQEEQESKEDFEARKEAALNAQMEENEKAVGYTIPAAQEALDAHLTESFKDLDPAQVERSKGYPSCVAASKALQTMQEKRTNPNIQAGYKEGVAEKQPSLTADELNVAMEAQAVANQINQLHVSSSFRAINSRAGLGNQSMSHEVANVARYYVIGDGMRQNLSPQDLNRSVQTAFNGIEQSRQALSSIDQTVPQRSQGAGLSRLRNASRSTAESANPLSRLIDFVLNGLGLTTLAKQEQQAQQQEEMHQAEMQAAMQQAQMQQAQMQQAQMQQAQMQQAQMQAANPASLQQTVQNMMQMMAQMQMMQMQMQMQMQMNGMQMHGMQPMMGYQQPMMGYQQPMMGYQQPMAYQQPVMGYQQPMAYQQPVAAPPEAVLAPPPPEAAAKQPDAAKKQPEVAKKEPEAAKKQPEAAKKEPEAATKAPEQKEAQPAKKSAAPRMGR